MRESWTVRLNASTVGTVVVSIRQKHGRRRFPRNRNDIPWRVAEYLEAEDRSQRLMIRMPWSEVQQLQSTKTQRVTKRGHSIYVTFDLDKYPNIRT